MGYSKGSNKGKVYSKEHLQKKKKIWNRLMMHLKFVEKQEQAKPKISRWKETIKIGHKLMK
jgi:hypothetical protein